MAVLIESTMCIVNGCTGKQAGDDPDWKDPPGFEFAITLHMACPWHVAVLMARVLEGDEVLRNFMANGAINKWSATHYGTTDQA